jgi:capsular polysaccharide transport system ATP-binding protein
LSYHAPAHKEAPLPAGTIRRHVRISWSLGFKSSLHCAQTGAQNARFVARIYSVDSDALMAYAQDFSEIGRFMDMPAQSYSSGMRARLAFRM